MRHSAASGFTFGNVGLDVRVAIMPRHYLYEATGARQPQDLLRRDERLNGGKHPIVAKNVEKGVYEAGVLNFKDVRRHGCAEGNLDPTKLHQGLGRRRPYADYNWTAHPILDASFGDGFVDRLQAALVAIDDPELLEALQRPGGLVKASNDDFIALESLCRQIGMIRGEAK